MTGLAREQVVGVFNEQGVSVGFETGQETATTLLGVLEELRPLKAGVNFDPANMILYGMGDPVKSLEVLLPLVVQVHIKDALPAAKKGEWGREVVVGTGAVDWAEFLSVLTRFRKPINMVFEREAGDQRAQDIAAGLRSLQHVLPSGAGP